jgi:hypothetical protein
MNDTDAIRIFVEAGNPRSAWRTMDDRDRWPWRKLALEGKLPHPRVSPEAGHDLEPKRLIVQS